MRTLFIVMLGLLTLEGLVLATAPEFVKKIIAEAPKNLILLAGAVEAAIAVALLALYFCGML